LTDAIKAEFDGFAGLLPDFFDRGAGWSPTTDSGLSILPQRLPTYRA